MRIAIRFICMSKKHVSLGKKTHLNRYPFADTLVCSIQDKKHANRQSVEKN